MSTTKILPRKESMLCVNLALARKACAWQFKTRARFYGFNAALNYFSFLTHGPAADGTHVRSTLLFTKLHQNLSTIIYYNTSEAWFFKKKKQVRHQTGGKVFIIINMLGKYGRGSNLEVSGVKIFFSSKRKLSDCLSLI